MNLIRRPPTSFWGDLKMQAQELTGRRYKTPPSRQRILQAINLPKAGDKLKELQSKDPKELVEDAKEFARQKPGQTS
jgi:hypothetical protein